MIYVTVGTLFLDFPRLFNKVDAIAAKTGEEFIVQRGMGATEMPHCSVFAFKPREEIETIQRGARVIVCHGGIGSVIDALKAQRPLVIVPRLKRYREHLTDHQLDLAEAIQRRGWGRAILDIEELEDALANPPAPPEDYRPGKHRLVQGVRDAIERVAARKR